jgi:hypothetical protein
LALLPGALTPSLQEGLVRLGAWLPFAQAADMLAYFTRVRVAEATARRTTEAAGAAYVAVQTAQVEAIERGAPPAPAGPALQYLSADGAMAPLVGGAWAEVKTLAIGTVGVPVWGDGEWVVHTTDLSYFSRMTDAATFTRLATVETHRRGTATAKAVAAVMDGAEWEQGFTDHHRPDAARILDCPHAIEYVAQAAQAGYGAGTPAATTWLEEQRHELRHGDPQRVLDALREVRATLLDHAGEAGEEGAAVKTVTTSLEYLTKRQAQIRYAAFAAAGYPLASGATESANKVVVEARLKGAGMHWAPAHVDPMVALRTVAASDRWAEAWPQISAQRRQQARALVAARRRARRAGPPPAPPVAPVPVLPPAPGELCWRDSAPTAAAAARPVPAAPSGPRRPAADHPWRRGHLSRRAAALARQATNAEL